MHLLDIYEHFFLVISSHSFVSSKFTTFFDESTIVGERWQPPVRYYSFFFSLNEKKGKKWERKSCWITQTDIFYVSNLIKTKAKTNETTVRRYCCYSMLLWKEEEKDGLFCCFIALLFIPLTQFAVTQESLFSKCNWGT